MRNKQIIIKLSDDTNLSILQGRDANSTDDTVEFWDKVSDDVISNFIIPTPRPNPFH